MREAVSRIRRTLFSRSSLLQEATPREGESQIEAILPGHRYPFLYDSPSRHETKLAAVKPETLKKLLNLLPGNYDGNSGPLSSTHDWLWQQQAAVERLDPELLRGEGDDGVVRPFGDLPLCFAHGRLKPELVAALAVPLIEECLFRSDAYRGILRDGRDADDEAMGSIRAWLDKLDALNFNFMKLSPSEAKQLKDDRAHNPELKYFVPNRCAACIVALIGRSPIFSAGILASILARHELQQRHGGTLKDLKDTILRRKKPVPLGDRDALRQLFVGEARNFCLGRNGPRTVDEIDRERKRPPPALHRVFEVWMGIWRARARQGQGEGYYDWGVAAGRLAFDLVEGVLEREARLKEGRGDDDEEEEDESKGEGRRLSVELAVPIGTPTNSSFDEFEREAVVGRRSPSPLEREERAELENTDLESTELMGDRGIPTASDKGGHSVSKHDRSTCPSALLVPAPLRIGAQQQSEECPARTNDSENDISISKDPSSSPLNGHPKQDVHSRYEIPSPLIPGKPRRTPERIPSGLAQDDITFEDILRDSDKTARTLSPVSQFPPSPVPAQKQEQQQPRARENDTNQHNDAPEQKQPIPPPISPTAGKTTKRVLWYSDESDSPHRHSPTAGKKALPLHITNGAPSPISPAPPQRHVGCWTLVPVGGGQYNKWDSSDQRLEMRWVGEGAGDKKLMTLNDVFRAAWEYEGKKTLA